MDNNSIIGWVAMDTDFMCHFFFTKPTFFQETGKWVSGGERYLVPRELVGLITYRDEPKEVKLTMIGL